VTEDILLAIEVLQATITVQGRAAPVLRGVSLKVRQGGLLGVVGESGSGKTLTALSILRLLPRAARITGGQILYQDQDLLRLSEQAMQRLRGRDIAMIFQNAVAALNPVIPVGRQIADVYRVHQGGSESGAWGRAVKMLEVTGLPDPPRQARAYPHELSGGMAQRVMIAMALVGSPRLIIADEPTTGLDMTIQAQVLSLIRERVAEVGTTLVLISHDIAIVAEVCTDVAVMYAGEVLEYGPRDGVLDRPAHPYTRALLACAAAEVHLGERLPFIDGQVPSPQTEIRGCAFAPRCPTATAQCREHRPPLREVTAGHWVACHYA
jgi:oligopeptide/dipeptide ABC transporter ATP-binding protein